jgi:hypothetical protein
MVGNKIKINLNTKVGQILLGSLLGDGMLEKSYTSINPNFKERHCLEQKEYLIFKRDILTKYFGACVLNNEKFKKDIFNRGKVKVYHSIFFRTNSDERLLFYHKLFYPNSKKKITEKILNKLNWLGIAIWFMDDGDYFYRGRTINISIDPKFIIVVKRFFIKLGFNPKINGHKLRFVVEDSKKIIKKIKPYVLQMPENMHYKIGLDKKMFDIATKKKRLCDKLYNQKNRDALNKKRREYWNKNRDKINLKRRKIHEIRGYSQI